MIYAGRKCDGQITQTCPSHATLIELIPVRLSFCLSYFKGALSYTSTLQPYAQQKVKVVSNSLRMEFVIIFFRIIYFAGEPKNLRLDCRIRANRGFKIRTKSSGELV